MSGVEAGELLAKKFPRTLPRNLKKGGVPQPECRVRLSHPPTSATGHLAAAHFRGRHLTSRPGSSPDFPLREQVGMKNCRTSAREAYTIR